MKGANRKHSPPTLHRTRRIVERWGQHTHTQKQTPSRLTGGLPAVLLLLRFSIVDTAVTQRRKKVLPLGLSGEYSSPWRVNPGKEWGSCGSLVCVCFFSGRFWGGGCCLRATSDRLENRLTPFVLFADRWLQNEDFFLLPLLQNMIF